MDGFYNKDVIFNLHINGALSYLHKDDIPMKEIMAIPYKRRGLICSVTVTLIILYQDRFSNFIFC